MAKKGWKKEPGRHALASRGVRTKFKKNTRSEYSIVNGKRVFRPSKGFVVEMPHAFDYGYGDWNDVFTAIVYEINGETWIVNNEHMNDDIVAVKRLKKNVDEVTNSDIEAYIAEAFASFREVGDEDDVKEGPWTIRPLSKNDNSGNIDNLDNPWKRLAEEKGYDINMVQEVDEDN